MFERKILPKILKQGEEVMNTEMEQALAMLEER